MPFVSRVERNAIERGEQIGLEKGLREALIDIVQFRFQSVPSSLRKALEEISGVAILRSLRQKALQVESLQQFEESLPH